MAVNPNEDTEFNDALRQHGILPPKEVEPSTPPRPPSPTLSEELNDLDLDELRDRGEDTNDSDEERFIARLQRQKFNEVVQKQRDAKFGRVYPIAREDYTREVTEASCKTQDDSESPDPNVSAAGTGVVCFLYKDAHPPSQRVFEHLHTLASKYPNTKFVSIVGSKCIPNYPDKNIPTLILYRNGQVVDQLIAWGAKDSEPGTIHHLETVLLALGLLDVRHMAPSSPMSKARRSDDDGHDKPSNIRSKQDDDSDSDFDL